MKRNARVLSLILSALTTACPDAGTQTSDSGTGTTTTTPLTSDGHSSAPPVTSSVSGTTSPGSTGPTDVTTTCFDPNDCGEAVVNITFMKPSVMLVLDKSGSMVADPNGFWDHDADPATPTITRWNSLHSGVDLFVTGFEGSMHLGAVLFPSLMAASSYNEAACVVGPEPEVAIAPMHAAKILATIPGALADSMMMKGATPASKALKLAITELETAPNDLPKFMIFVTDGAANCQENAPDPTTLFEVYDDAVMETVAAAAAMGIKTYVVGIDISQEVSGEVKDGNPDNTNSHEKLNLMADAGGVPRPGAEKFFNATNQNELQAALQTIAMELVSCTLDLDPTPRYPDFVEITPYGKSQVLDCMTEDGWMYLPKQDPNDPEELTRVQLCGQACSDLQMSGEVDVQYRCPDDDSC